MPARLACCRGLAAACVPQGSMQGLGMHRLLRGALAAPLSSPLWPPYPPSISPLTASRAHPAQPATCSLPLHHTRWACTAPSSRQRRTLKPFAVQVRPFLPCLFGSQQLPRRRKLCCWRACWAKRVGLRAPPCPLASQGVKVAASLRACLPKITQYSLPFATLPCPVLPCCACCAQCCGMRSSTQW